MITKLTSAALATALFAGLALAQNFVAPINLEQTAPALPVDEVPLAATAAQDAAASVETTRNSAGHATSAGITDYTNQIGTGLKERERRLTLLNEAMMKLREAGEMEDAGRVEERIRGLLAMPAPSQLSTQLKAEIEQMRTKNDELIVQMVAMEEELKRYRGPSGSIVRTKR